MVPVVFPEANFVLCAPSDWDTKVDGICNDLHVIRDNSQNTFTSFWHPDVAELAALNAGGSVMLVVKASAHPPIILATTDPKDKTSVAGRLALIGDPGVAA
jgi:hypothetical protein